MYGKYYLNEKGMKNGYGQIYSGVLFLNLTRVTAIWKLSQTDTAVRSSISVSIIVLVYL